MTLARRYGVWLLIGASFIVWELLGLRRLERFIPVAAWLKHPSLSQIVWTLPLPARLAIDAVLIDVCVHFAAQTPLVPGI